MPNGEIRSGQEHLTVVSVGIPMRPVLRCVLQLLNDREELRGHASCEAFGIGGRLETQWLGRERLHVLFHGEMTGPLTIYRMATEHAPSDASDDETGLQERT